MYVGGGGGGGVCVSRDLKINLKIIHKYCPKMVNFAIKANICTIPQTG